MHFTLWLLSDAALVSIGIKTGMPEGNTKQGRTCLCIIKIFQSSEHLSGQLGVGKKTPRCHQPIKQGSTFVSVVCLANILLSFFALLMVCQNYLNTKWGLGALTHFTLYIYNLKVLYLLFSPQFAKNPPKIFAIIEIAWKYVDNSKTPCSATGQSSILYLGSFKWGQVPSIMSARQSPWGSVWL